MPKISIIVPVFNSEAYLSDCIKSLLLQTIKDFEVLLIDDGSSDASPDICDEYALKDNRIRAYHVQNGGVSKARNVGINVAKGDFLMFCDADDIVDEHWCGYLLDIISENPNKLVVSGWQRFNNPKDISKISGDEIITEEKSIYDIFKLHLSGSVCNKVFRSDIVKAHNLLFNEEIPLAEDVIFVSEYYSFMSNGCIYVKCPLYYYRCNSDSAIHSYNSLAALYYTKAYYKRALVIETNYLEDYCNEWLNGLLLLFDNVFDKRNDNMNLIEKIAFNQKIMCMKEFSYCIDHCSRNAEGPIVMYCLKLRLYFFLFFVQKLSTFKKLIKDHIVI